MNKRITAAVTTAIVASGIVLGAAGTAMASDGTAPAAPAATADARHISITDGDFSYEATVTGGEYKDVSRVGAVDDGFGIGTAGAVAPDGLDVSMPLGGTFGENGTGGMAMGGVVGSDVTTITVTLSDGSKHAAVIHDGLWAIAFQSDLDIPTLRAEVEYTTTDGSVHSLVSE